MDKRTLKTDEINAALGRLSDWEFVGGKLCREFRFRDFSEAFGFMTRVALVAENIGHHPEWSNVYGTVKVELFTHDVNGITDFDLTMAGKMDVFAAPLLKAVDCFE
ncbi:MAG: 4a-hydroxytetrahydrobiopterin dehydratase [Planctomycetota bacterium]|jgi:4a-hydroxytetrahydrobiopterin dehydratase